MKRQAVGFLLLPILFPACGAGGPGARSASPPATVTPEPRNPTDFRPHFPFAYAKGRAQVYSDLGPDFSKQHGDHLALVYDYFARLFARSYGGAAVAYYTQDQGLYQRVIASCPTVVIPGARNVTGCYDPGTGVQSLFIVPYLIPDFGTQLHEFSHQFLYGHPEPVRVYSQAGMLLFYLMHKQPVAMNRAFAALNAGSVRNNAQLVSLILAESGLTLAELDEAYVAYALAPPS